MRPILEYGAARWVPYREGQICALDRVQKKAAKFAYRMTESNWETLSQRRKISRICALFKAYSGERAWKAIGDRLQRPNYLSRIDHEWKIRNRRQKRTDIGKYSFVNRTIRLWNRLPAEILGTLRCKPSAFRKRVRRVVNMVNWVGCKRSRKCSELKWGVVQWTGVKSGCTMKGIYGWWSELKWSEVKCSEVKWSESPVKNLYFGGFILFCSVCMCVCVCVCVCVCMSGFCNVCVCEGFVMCGCF